jgi:hypothetical protein
MYIRIDDLGNDRHEPLYDAASVMHSTAKFLAETSHACRFEILEALQLADATRAC